MRANETTTQLHSPAASRAPERANFRADFPPPAPGEARRPSPDPGRRRWQAPDELRAGARAAGGGEGPPSSGARTSSAPQWPPGAVARHTCLLLAACWSLVGGFSGRWSPLAVVEGGWRCVDVAAEGLGRVRFRFRVFVVGVCVLWLRIIRWVCVFNCADSGVFWCFFCVDRLLGWNLWSCSS